MNKFYIHKLYRPCCLGFNVPAIIRSYSTSGNKSSNSFYLKDFVFNEPPYVIDNFFEDVEVIREKDSQFPYSEYP
jgi:hypothetical protein